MVSLLLLEPEYFLFSILANSLWLEYPVQRGQHCSCDVSDEFCTVLFSRLWWFLSILVQYFSHTKYWVLSNMVFVSIEHIMLCILLSFIMIISILHLLDDSPYFSWLNLNSSWYIIFIYKYPSHNDVSVNDEQHT